LIIFIADFEEVIGSQLIWIPLSEGELNKFVSNLLGDDCSRATLLILERDSDLADMALVRVV